MKNKKVLIIVSSIIAVIIVGIIICAIALVVYMGWIFGGYPYKEIQSSISNNTKNKVIIFQKDARGFFGPSDIIIKANHNNFWSKIISVHLYETKIYDDGGKGSVNIKWKDNNAAYVTLDGCEMEEVNIQIEFDNNNIRFITKDATKLLD